MTVDPSIACNCSLGWQFQKGSGPDPAKCPVHGDPTPTVEKDAPACGKPRRYFPQQTCELSAGHAGDHEDATHLWENATSVIPPAKGNPA